MTGWSPVTLFEASLPADRTRSPCRSTGKPFPSSPAFGLRLGDRPGPDPVRRRVNDAHEEIHIMFTEPSALTLPYDQDPRFAELEDLIAALEAKWAQETKDHGN